MRLTVIHTWDGILDPAAASEGPCPAHPRAGWRYQEPSGIAGDLQAVHQLDGYRIEIIEQ